MNLPPTRTSHAAFCQPVYFPFTFISQPLVEVMSLCFHRILVYEPAHAETQQALRPWVEKGFLEIRRPLDKFMDKKNLGAALRDFRNWGLFHQHGDMVYLKTSQNDIAPADPAIARIAADIRGKAAELPNTSDQGELPLQLFLHFAQEFDQHAWELREELYRVDQQYESLKRAFRQDQNGHDDEPTARGPFPAAQEDRGGFMIEKRMSGWNHLFQNDPANTGLLFTDSPSALAHLLDAVQEKVEALRFNITYTLAGSQDVPRERPTWADHLDQLFKMVCETPWNKDLQERIARRSREVKAELDQWQGPSMKSPYENASFCWYVFPHQVPGDLFNRCCGVESSYQENHAMQVQNMLVGLIEWAV